MTRPRARGRGHDVGGGGVDEMPPPGAAFHFRADLGVTVSGGVAAWADQSGNGRHAIQGTPGNQPTLVGSVAALANRPVIRFDGSDRLVTSAFSLSNVMSLYFVLGAVTARGMLVEHGLGTHWYAYSTGSSAVYFLGHNAAQNPVTTWAQANQQGAFIYDRSAAPVLYGNRAVLTPTGTTGSPPSAGTVNAALVIGGRSDATLHHTGDIAEIIGYDAAHDAATRARVQNYLFNRYGV